jgi:hypothetical protein
MAPPRPSRSSCPPPPGRVNEDPGPRPPARPCRRLVRRVLKAESGLRGYVPRVYEPPDEPPGADEVLAAVASCYRPGDAVGLRQVRECIAITQDKAQAVRAWAIGAGAWPYLTPGACRPPASPRRKAVTP